jgi:hypothetical protein
MHTTTPATLSHRDRAVLRAVAAGRCGASAATGDALVIDGLCLSDQFVAPRLRAAGFIVAGPTPGPVWLTDAGAALLEAA